MMVKIRRDTDSVDIQDKLDKFLLRILKKVAPANHELKKTDRIKLPERFPEYQEETSPPAETKQIDFKTIYKLGYDSELLAKLKSFLAFIKEIFKK